MSVGSPPSTGSKIMLWAGRILSALAVLGLFSSGVMKILKAPANVIEEFARFGYPESLIVTIGVVEVVCALIYALPYSATLGAILLTGYLGGAVATHVRIGDPFVFPIVGGVMVWLGLLLRNSRIRSLLPIRWL